ncbi:hypothetical protein HDU97_000832 [Phlyctochytrium planicorne]|nr:hypothetical protein HDU97_000832 [Phlyctochytrium planicorne]
MRDPASPEHAKEKLIRTLPIFQNVSNDNADEFFSDLAGALHLRHHLPGDMIIEEGEVAKTVFFIIRGQVEVLTSGGDVTLAELNSGAFSTVRATSKCLLAVLSADDLRRCLKKYPSLLELIQTEAKERFSKLASEMEKNGKRLDMDVFEKSEEGSDEDLQSEALPAVPSISIEISGMGLTRNDSHDGSEGDSENSKGELLAPSSYSQTFSKKQTLRRRASVAVWSDDRLLKIAQSISAKDSSLQPSKVRVSSTLAQDTRNRDDVAGDTDSELIPGFGRLTREIFARIVKRLDFKCLWRLRALNKAISQLLLDSDLELANSVDLSPWHKKIDDDVVRNVMDFCGKSIRVLNLRNCWQVTDKGIQEIANYGSGLERIILASVWDITDNGLAGLAEGVTNLRFIDLSNCRKLTDNGILSILSNAPTIVNMQMSYCKNLSDTAMNHTTWASLRAINMQRCTGITDAGFGEWEKLGRPFDLRELVLSDCSFLSDVAVASIARCCPNLEILNLSFCCALTESFVGPLVEGCPQIRIFDLSFCGAAVTDSSLNLITTGLCNLERLSIRGCVQVTEAGLQYLKSAKLLKVINFSQCRNLSVSAADASTLNWTIIKTGSLYGDESKEWTNTKQNQHLRALTA